MDAIVQPTPFTDVPAAPAFPAPATAPPPTPAPAPAAAEPPGAPPAPAQPEHWTAKVLVEEGDLRRDALRFGAGLALAGAYGLALGTRRGGLAILSSAALVPAAFVAACAFGLPALYIAFAMVDAPVAPRRLWTSASRATAAAGLVLAGLAPVAALYVVSSETRVAAALAADVGLAAGALVGFRALWIDLLATLGGARERVRIVAVGSLLAFGLFAAAVAIRVWKHLPLFAPEVM